MSFFPVVTINELLRTLSERAKHDVKEELFSRAADKRRIALRLREILPTAFDLEYIENAIFPALVTSVYRYVVS